MVGHLSHTHDIIELIKRFEAYYFSSIMLQESSMAFLHLIFSWKMHMSLWMKSIGYGTNNMGILSTSLQVPRVEHLNKLYSIYYKNKYELKGCFLCNYPPFGNHQRVMKALFEQDIELYILSVQSISCPNKSFIMCWWINKGWNYNIRG